ncbi:hypothetical protein QTP86_021345 [Hemibagrus guttatus]|nr:hypothetical protein QTP86_021345 [Hemibagrus guttatus]
MYQVSAVDHQTRDQRTMLQWLSDIFWQEHLWFPDGLGWADLEDRDGRVYAKARDLWVALPIAFVFLVLRQIFERTVGTYLASLLGIKETIRRNAAHNPALEMYYSHSSKYPTQVHTLYYTTQEHTLYYTTQEHTLYYTTQEDILYYTTQEHTLYYTTQEHTLYYTTQEHTLYYTTQEHTLYYTTQEHTLYYTTQEHTLYYTTQEHTLYYTTQVHTLYYTTQEHTLYYTTQEHTLYYTTQEHTLYYTTQEHTLYYTTQEHTLYYTTQEHTLYYTTQEHTLYYTTQEHTLYYTTQKSVMELCRQSGCSEKQLQRWFRRRRNQDRPILIKKFREASWRFVIYLLAFVAGLVALIDKPWLYDLEEMWKGFPTLDFKEQIIHHVATITLISFSWCMNYIRAGTLVMFLHDSSDYLLESAKMFNYAGWRKACNYIFIVFAMFFIVTRLIIFPFRILYCTWVYPLTIYPPFFGYYFFNGLLLVLQSLHIFWAALIIRMALRFLPRNEIVEDERSDRDETDDSEDEERNGEMKHGAIRNGYTTQNNNHRNHHKTH